MRCVTLAQADGKKTTERPFLYLTCNNCFLNLWLYVLLLKYRLNMGFEKKKFEPFPSPLFQKIQLKVLCLNSSF